MFDRLHRRLFERVDPASLVVFRVVFGVMAAVSAARFFWYGWVDRFFYERTFFFHFPGFEWVHPLPEPGMHVLFGVLVAAGLAVAAGLFYRVALVVFVVGFTYVGLIDTTNYLNHYWLFRFVGFLMLFMPLGRFGSVDALRRSAADGADAERGVPAWMVWTLRLQLGVVYFFAGVAKLNWDWLVRGQPMEIWLNARTDLPLVGPLLGLDWLPHAMSLAGAAFDLSIFFLLLVPASRRFAYLAVAAFHGATGFLFNIGMFPIIMVGLTAIFFEPNWPRRFVPAQWLEAIGLGEPDEGRLSRGSGTAPRRRRWVVAGLSLWFALQFALPLRHLAYPGDVNWTQEGFRFAWRVKLVERGGYLKFRVTSPDFDAVRVVHPSRYLTRRQVELASVEPAKILQLAHQIEREFVQKGYTDVEVRADTRVSLNGRPSRPIVDPEVDLSEKPYDVRHREWILDWREEN